MNGFYNGTSSNRFLITAVVILSAFLSFYKLGMQDICEWDESRNGVNAVEMMHNKDYINLYYGGELDTWNNKPPLLTYLILLSYKIFGLNQFALRFPSALATVLFFYFCYKMFSLYEKSNIAFLGCIILMSCKGIIGDHVGRTGDYDALLLLFLTVAIYNFLKFLDFNFNKGIYLFAIFMGLALLTKGTGSLIILPGLFIYSMVRKKLKQLISSKHVWFSVLIFIGIVSFWIGALILYGKEYSNSIYGSKNALETMFRNDTLGRISGSVLNQKSTFNWSYFFTVIDAKLNLWNYLFYLSLGVIIFQFLKMKTEIKILIKEQKHFFLIFSLIQVFAFGVVLTLMKENHVWYLTPAFPFIVYIVLIVTKFLINKIAFYKYVIFGLLILTLIRHFTYLNNPEMSMTNFFKENELLTKIDMPFYIVDQPTQSLYLYLLWQNRPVRKISSEEINNIKSGILCANAKTKLNTDTNKEICYKDFCFFQIR